VRGATAAATLKERKKKNGRERITCINETSICLSLPLSFALSFMLMGDVCNGRGGCFSFSFLVDDLRTADRYFSPSHSLAAEICHSLVTFFVCLSLSLSGCVFFRQSDRQAARAKESKRNVTDQNYQTLRLPISANDG
jgi:hypothetical protein